MPNELNKGLNRTQKLVNSETSGLALGNEYGSPNNALAFSNLKIRNRSKFGTMCKLF